MKPASEARCFVLKVSILFDVPAFHEERELLSCLDFRFVCGPLWGGSGFFADRRQMLCQFSLSGFALIAGSVRVFVSGRNSFAFQKFETCRMKWQISIMIVSKGWAGGLGKSI
jgi:hypothetical protein